jgi:hypothetical protein
MMLNTTNLPVMNDLHRTTRSRTHYADKQDAQTFYNSRELQKKILPKEVRALNDQDLLAFQIELKTDIGKIDLQLADDTNNDQSWRHRASSKRMLMCVFLDACTHEENRRLLVAKLESDRIAKVEIEQAKAARLFDNSIKKGQLYEIERMRLKNERKRLGYEHEREVNKVTLEIVFKRLAQEWGKEKSANLLDDCRQIAKALIAQERPDQQIATDCKAA